MSEFSVRPVTEFALGSAADHGDSPPKPDQPAAPPSASTALVPWTPPVEPGGWQRLRWGLFGRPEPGLDGRYDHVIVDASLVSIPKDRTLAALVLALGKQGDLSVKNLYNTLADGSATPVKPKLLAATRKELRLAAEKLEARSPAARVADAARARLEVLQRDLDAIDALRTQPQQLAERRHGGSAALLAGFDGHHAELGALLTGAEALSGHEPDALAVIRASLAGIVKRREALATSLDTQLQDLHNAKLERDASASRAQAAAATAERDALRAEQARIAAITGLDNQARVRWSDRLSHGAKRGGRFFTTTGDPIRTQDVLSHLALGTIDFGIVPPALNLKAILLEALGFARKPAALHPVRDLAQLDELLKRLAGGAL